MGGVGCTHAAQEMKPMRDKPLTEAISKGTIARSLAVLCGLRKVPPSKHLKIGEDTTKA